MKELRNVVFFKTNNTDIIALFRGDFIKGGGGGFVHRSN